MRQIKQVLKIASVYVGTVIGAGFASGQEIIHFFTRYGTKGIYGLFFAGILYSIIGAVLLEIIYERKYQCYQSLLKELVGERIGKGLEWIVTLFLFVCLSAMLAGSGAILNEQFNVPFQVGVLVMGMLVILTLLSGIRGFIRMNLFIVPVLCIGGIMLGSYIVIFRDVSVFAIHQSVNTGSWLISSVIYVAYNTVTVIVVLSGMGKEIGSRRVARYSGILGGMMLGVLGLSIGVSTLIYYSRINTLEIPMLGVLLNYPVIFKYLYIVLLLCAMYTTAIANGYGIMENISCKIKINKKILGLGIILASILGANVGFSTIVSTIYPIFGYVGIFEIIMIIVYYIYIKIGNRRN